MEVSGSSMQHSSIDSDGSGESRQCSIRYIDSDGSGESRQWWCCKISGETQRMKFCQQNRNCFTFEKL